MAASVGTSVRENWRCRPYRYRPFGHRTLGFQQCAQECHSLAVAVTFAQHFGRPVGPMSRQPFQRRCSVCSAVRRHRCGVSLQFIGASGSNFIRQHFGLGRVQSTSPVRSASGTWPAHPQRNRLPADGDRGSCLREQLLPVGWQALI